MTIKLDAPSRARLVANLFTPAHAAIPDWDRFPWHRSRATGEPDAWQDNSSQALAVDVFGTLSLAPERHEILDRLAASLGLPPGGPWEVELEWSDPKNRLREPRPTQVDALARSERALILFECKFTETDGGACSQTGKKMTPQGDRKAQCDGHYRDQVNTVNGVRANCALSGKGIRYWELIPEVFDLDPDRVTSPCPFAGSWYQWMRNLCLCLELAHSEGLATAFLVVYAGSPALPFPKVLAGESWLELKARLRAGTVPLGTLSYQEFLAGARQRHGGVWGELEGWVTGKVGRVTWGNQ